MTLDPEAVAKAIGVPVAQWPGNCFCVAVQMLKAEVVTGKSRYGHYHGFIHPDCEKFGGREFTHHGWIEDGETLIDPTRWVFECAKPYIYFGEADDPDYDFGGNRLRRLRMKPPPSFDPTKGKGTWELPELISDFCTQLLGCSSNIVSAGQVLWLANLPLDILGDFAKPVFEFIRDDVELPGFIPIDNRLDVLGPDND